MDTETNRFLYKKETHQIIGSAMEVLNELGHGFGEKSYENALVVEFGLRNIPYRQQPHFDVTFKSVNVGLYVPDLIAYDKIVVELKTIDHITNHEMGQVMNYLKITGMRVGLILNFKYSRLEYERVAL